MKYSIFVFCIAFAFSCGNEYDLNEFFDLEDLPGYVAFNAPGNSAILDDVLVKEDDTAASLTIENPTGTLSDITVEYDFGGDAVFGVDFNVAGASASGGTIVLKHQPTDVPNTNRVDLDIEILMDGLADGEKTLTITLMSASNAEGPLAVGRGGTDFLKTATVIIEDID